MRSDALGLFWQDEPPKPKEKKEKFKAVPPDRTWERDDYLPGLDEALACNIDLMSITDLETAYYNREELLVDIECYSNYFEVGFKSLQSDKVIYFEADEENELNGCMVHWILHGFRTTGFNSLNYDIPMLTLALAGFTCFELKRASDELIQLNLRPWQILRNRQVKKLEIDHIDIIEVAPSRTGLKQYGGRLHTPAMQDLPFPHQATLSKEQKAIVRWYNINKDLVSTKLLREALVEELHLREGLSNEYHIDLRSKSDAQIAQAVFQKQLETRKRRRINPPNIAEGSLYKYNTPHFLQFQSEWGKYSLDCVQRSNLVVDWRGKIEMPEELKQLEIPMGNNKYRMGRGGLHSTEHSVSYFSNDYLLYVFDVTSYYPYIILNCNLYPFQLGPEFLEEYRKEVERRILAKSQGNKKWANSLKILINGTFGKLGQQGSILYAPDLMMQVTLTGQLALLMLIESLELNGISVLSGNTDGIVCQCHKNDYHTMKSVISAWEHRTNFVMEETQYAAYVARDVNNYMAVKIEPDNSYSIKAKGAYKMPGLMKNPTCTICVRAMHELLTAGKPMEETILSSRDIREFVQVRKVKGGAVVLHEDQVNNEYLGETIRWYYGTEDVKPLIYASSGNRVADATGAKQLMELPDIFPSDLDFDYYIKRAHKMLSVCGYPGYA